MIVEESENNDLCCILCTNASELCFGGMPEVDCKSIPSVFAKLSINDYMFEHLTLRGDMFEHLTAVLLK